MPLGLEYVPVLKFLLMRDIDCGLSRLGQIVYAFASYQNDRSKNVVPSQSILVCNLFSNFFDSTYTLKIIPNH